MSYVGKLFSVWRIISDCPIQPDLPIKLKTHIAFSMFPILDTNLWQSAYQKLDEIYNAHEYITIRRILFEFLKNSDDVCKILTEKIEKHQWSFIYSFTVGIFQTESKISKDLRESFLIFKQVKIENHDKNSLI